MICLAITVNYPYLNKSLTVTNILEIKHEFIYKTSTNNEPLINFDALETMHLEDVNSVECPNFDSADEILLDNIGFYFEGVVQVSISPTFYACLFRTKVSHRLVVQSNTGSRQ